MKTLGVDLAAATKKTAVALLDWGTDTTGNASARLAHLALDVDDQHIVELFGSCDIQAKIAQLHGPQPRDGSGRLAEVYPAASLKIWGLNGRGYKGRGIPEAERLALLLAALEDQAPWLDLNGHREQPGGFGRSVRRSRRRPDRPGRRPPSYAPAG